MATIVLIDDDLDLLETVGALLENAGFTIHSSDTVEGGLELIAAHSPDLVLLDLLFPEDSSLGPLTAAKIKKRYPGLPLFVMTAIYREYAFSVRREEIPADEFLTKPVRLERLIELIQGYVG